MQAQHESKELEGYAVLGRNKRNNIICECITFSSHSTREEQIHAQTISHIVLALSDTVTKKVAYTTVAIVPFLFCTITLIM